MAGEANAGDAMTRLMKIVIASCSGLLWVAATHLAVCADEAGPAETAERATLAVSGKAKVLRWELVIRNRTPLAVLAPRTPKEVELRSIPPGRAGRGTRVIHADDEVLLLTGEGFIKTGELSLQKLKPGEYEL